MHETEIIKNLDHDLFSFPGYSIETENNSTCSRVAIYMMSFPNLHEMAGRATPDKMIDYKLALQQLRVVNYHIPAPDLINVNLNNIQTTRQTKFVTQRTNRLKIGMNILSDRFYYLNGKIELDWLNLPFGSYKVKCKKLFL